MREDIDDQGNFTHEGLIRPTYFDPPLVLITPPDATPDRVKDAITAASRLLFADPGAAANRLRLAVEKLMDVRRVKKWTSSGKAIQLAPRLHDFTKRSPGPAKVLEAVKWIGNTGTHDDRLTLKDVLLGAELLELALRLIYDTRDAELIELADYVKTHDRLPRRRSAR